MPHAVARHIHDAVCDLNIKCQRISFNNKSYSSKITAHICVYGERVEKKVSRMKNEAVLSGEHGEKEEVDDGDEKKTMKLDPALVLVLN